MKIIDFDIKRGTYSFELDDLNTAYHSHPVIEVISTIDGTFDLTIKGQKMENLVFAIINPNIEHKLSSKNCLAKMLMLESNNLKLEKFLEKSNINLSFDHLAKEEFSLRENIFKAIKEFSQINCLKKPEDKRVEQCISIIETKELEYSNLLENLTSEIFLSESRLSHLFKEHIGVSLKKYLVWHKLRNTIQFYLTQDNNLTESSLTNGFFDQAHLSNSFKKVLGVNPSKVYNSRTLQF